MNINLMPFTAHDWMGFAGAESFSEGCDPLIGEVSHGVQKFTIVVDKSCISLMALDDDSNLGGWEYLWPTEPSSAEVAEFGFRLVQAPWENAHGWMRLA